MVVTMWIILPTEVLVELDCPEGLVSKVPALPVEGVLAMVVALVIAAIAQVHVAQVQVPREPMWIMLQIEA